MPPLVKEETIAKTMTYAACAGDCQRFGRHRNGLRRFRSPICKQTFTEAHTNPLGSMTVLMDKALLALKLLIEGNRNRPEHDHETLGGGR
jgi:transposase-like protein